VYLFFDTLAMCIGRRAVTEAEKSAAASLFDGGWFRRVSQYSVWMHVWYKARVWQRVRVRDASGSGFDASRFKCPTRMGDCRAKGGPPATNGQLRDVHL